MSITKEHIKAIKRLHDHKERAVEGLFLIEGVRLLEEALKERALIEEAIYTQRLEEAPRGKAIVAALRDRSIPVFRVTERVMEQAALTETPQGVLAVVRQMNWSFKDIVRDKGSVVIACGLQDPGNLGAIIRTADAGGISGVIAAEQTVDIYNSKVVRATMGSIFRMPILRVSDLEKTLYDLKKEGYKVVAASSKSRVSYLDADYMKPSVFLIGQEASGLSEDVLELADIRVSIPMNNGVESLNAAVSAAILIYEAFRQQSRP